MILLCKSNITSHNACADSKKLSHLLTYLFTILLSTSIFISPKHLLSLEIDYELITRHIWIYIILAKNQFSHANIKRYYHYHQPFCNILKKICCAKQLFLVLSHMLAILFFCTHFASLLWLSIAAGFLDSISQQDFQKLSMTDENFAG